MLLAERTRNYAPYVTHNAFFIIINDYMEVEAMNWTTCNLVQKLVCLEDIEGGKLDVVHG